MNERNTCAGKPISKAIHMFSEELMEGCRHFTQIAMKSRDPTEIMHANTACIFFAVSCVEAKVNEFISIAQEIDEEKMAFWNTLKNLQKTLGLEDKWDLIASFSDAPLWDHGKEPFQSFGTIVSLRNELIHYKGHFLDKDEAPRKRIQDLFQKFHIKSKATFIGDDVSTWVFDLLKTERLGKWVKEKTEGVLEEFKNILSSQIKKR